MDDRTPVSTVDRIWPEVVNDLEIRVDRPRDQDGPKRVSVGSLSYLGRVSTRPTLTSSIVRDAAAHIFSPAFLWMVHRGEHDRLLGELSLDQYGRRLPTIRALLDGLYGALDRSYRSEYFFKNEIIRRVFEARHNPDRSVVLLEKHIGNWASRVDLIVVNGTTTAYEIKTDLDDFSRLRLQTEHALAVFDRVYVVCSEQRVALARQIVDERVGVLGMRKDGSFRRDRAAVANAENVVPSAIFDLLREKEYLSVLKRLFGSVPTTDPIERYQRCADIFSTVAPRTAHAALAHILRRRYVRPDRQALAQTPYALGHLYYKATPKERSLLFSPAILGARVRCGASR